MKGTKSQKKSKVKSVKSRLSTRAQKQGPKRASMYQTIKKGKTRRGLRQPGKSIKLRAKAEHSKRNKAHIVAKSAPKNKIVRIMGHGQFSVDSNILQRLNEIDNLLVRLVNMDRPDDNEFKKHLVELTSIVEKNGKRLDSKQIIQSDIILPSADLSIDEAKRLFIGEGVVPEL